MTCARMCCVIPAASGLPASPTYTCLHTRWQSHIHKPAFCVVLANSEDKCCSLHDHKLIIMITRLIIQAISAVIVQTEAFVLQNGQDHAESWDVYMRLLASVEASMGGKQGSRS